MNNTFAPLDKRGDIIYSGKHTYSHSDTVEHNNDGEGWINNIMINNGLCEEMYVSATAPLVIVHDLTEHINGIQNIGSINEEFAALGVAYHLRMSLGVLQLNDNDRNKSGSDAIRVLQRSIASMLEEAGDMWPTDYFEPETLTGVEMDEDIYVFDEAADGVDAGDDTEIIVAQGRAAFNYGLVKGKDLYPDSIQASNLQHELANMLRSPLKYCDTYDKFHIEYAFNTNTGEYGIKVGTEYDHAYHNQKILNKLKSEFIAS